MLQTRNVILASAVFPHEEELSLHLSDNSIAHLSTPANRLQLDIVG